MLCQLKSPNARTKPPSIWFFFCHTLLLSLFAIVVVVACRIIFFGRLYSHHQTPLAFAIQHWSWYKLHLTYISAFILTPPSSLPLRSRARHGRSRMARVPQ